MPVPCGAASDAGVLRAYDYSQARMSAGGHVVGHRLGDFACPMSNEFPSPAPRERGDRPRQRAVGEGRAGSALTRLAARQRATLSRNAGEGLFRSIPPINPSRNRALARSEVTAHG
jgi:hypothetical protein